MKIAALLAPLLVLFAAATPTFAQSNEQSSPADRQRFVTIVHKLESAPLDPRLRNDRAWAIQWLTDAPDVTVIVCPEPIGRVSDKTYPHVGEVLIQYALGMAAFIVENPGKAEDMDAQQLAGVESALKAYVSMRAAQPNEKAPELEDLLAKQSRGELPDVVHKAYLSCKAKK